MSRDHGTGLFKIENLARGTAEAMPDGTLDGKLVSIHLKGDIAKIEEKKIKKIFSRRYGDRSLSLVKFPYVLTV